jgi:CRP-like cAMP-binding protein
VATSAVRAIQLTKHQVRMIADESPAFAGRLRAAAALREQHLL